MNRVRRGIEFLKGADPSSFRKSIRLLKDPIFVLGCGRSGTTLMLSLLGAHPRIHSLGPESGIFLHPPVLPFRSLDTWWRILKLYHFYLRHESIDEGVLRLCEKTPRHVRFIPRIRRAFHGRARMIHMVRDGRDVVTSRLPGKADFHVPVERWIRDVQYGKMQEGSSDLLLVRYEDLVREPWSTLERVMAFLSEEVHPDQKEHHLKSSVQRHAAFEKGSAEPVRTDPIGRWKGDPELEERAKGLESDPLGRELLSSYGYL